MTENKNNFGAIVDSEPLTDDERKAEEAVERGGSGNTEREKKANEDIKRQIREREEREAKKKRMTISERLKQAGGD